MSDKVASEMGAVWRAIAPVAGTLFGFLSNCKKDRVAAWMVHGDADTTVPISGGRAVRDMLVANNHCASTTQPVEPSPCVAHDNCDAGYPVIWCEVAGGQHAIPSFVATGTANFLKQF